jgi:hypothetical protein
MAQKINGLCSKRLKTIDRNVSNFCLKRFSHLLQPINNIFNGTDQVVGLLVSNDFEHLFLVV